MPQLDPSIWLIASGFDVEPLRQQLAAHPEIWNQRPLRTRAYAGSPHDQIDDIWVRFKPWQEVAADPAHCCDEHVSEFYPEAEKIPAVFDLIARVMELVGASDLGGVLITRVPAGKSVAWHVDTGWHAEHYRKVAVQIAGNQHQVFKFEDSELRPRPGDVYEFINQRPHAVFNDSTEDRMTLIICVK